MRATEIAKPLGVFVLVIAVVLAGTAVLSLAAGSGGGQADGATIDGQSPSQFQPEAVNAEQDPEEGEVDVGSPDGEKRILFETAHNNRFQQEDIEPVVEALAAAGHEVDVGAASSGFDGGYNQTLQQYDAVVVVSPQSAFSAGERTALRNYADGGGRLAVLGEATQPAVASGSVSMTLGQMTFGANGLTSEFGARMGSDTLYNLDDEATDNNFESIYAEPSGDGTLTAGVERVTFDRAGYIVPTGDVDVRYTAVDGTRQLQTDREGELPVVVRSDNVVFVADSDFITRSELYDADNEVFVGNLLTFLVSGDKPDDVPEASGSDDF